jgi:hypothetical protein
MAADISEVAAMDRSGLLALWVDEIGGAPPRRLSTPLMRRILAFEVQARRHGGLPSSVQRRLARIAAGEDRPKSPMLKRGGRLVREWNGISHVVDVTADGVRWRGELYRSLSAVARAITGAHWSGPRFFGLKGRVSP